MFHVDNKIKRHVYMSIFGKTEQEVDEDVKVIKKWLTTQPHLPEIMDDRKIRNILNLCKFNIKKVKRKIDNYYTIRSKYPDFFEDSNPKLPHLLEEMEQTYLCAYPQLLDDLHRLSFLKPREPNKLNVLAIAKRCLAMLEIRLQDDFIVDDIIVIDMANITLNDICKLSFSILYKCFNIYKEVYTLRIQGIYYINSPSYITILLKMLKLIVPAKIYSRIKVHKDADVLKEMFSMAVLPKDYGGNGPSLNELDELAKNEMLEYAERFNLLDQLRVDERLRPKN